jgi:hypothetical protein
MTRTKLKPLFRMTGQKNAADCVVASLAMALGLPYEEVLVVASRLQPKVLKRGLYTIEAQLIADEFGRSLLKRKLKIDIDEDTGVLMIKMRCGRGFTEHAVFLTNGLVFAPESDGEVWDAETYLKFNKARVLHLLEED